MSPITSYHNVSCLKSLRGSELIRENGIEPFAIFCVNYKCSIREVLDIVKKLNVALWDILRSDKKLLIEHRFAITTMSDVKIVDIISPFPKLLERAIVTDDFFTIMRRTPQNVLRLLKERFLI